MKIWKSVAFIRHAFTPTLLLFLMLFCAAALPLAAQKSASDTGSQTGAQTTANAFPVHVVRTDSPRNTMTSFLRLRVDLEKTLLSYMEETTRDKAEYAQVLMLQLASLVDLSTLPRASRSEIGRDTVAYLLDILGRVQVPDLNSIPDAEALADEEKSAKWQMPNTPIQIVRLDEGSREGEFLFSERTVRVAPRFFRRIKDLPLKSSLPINSWHLSQLQVTGPMIPPALARRIPASLKETWYGTPIWKVLAVFLIMLLGGLFVSLVRRFTARTTTDNKIGSFGLQLLTPVLIAAVVTVLTSFIDRELIISGTFSRSIDFIEILLIYLAFAWVFWIAIRIIFEWLILSPRIPDESLDANLLRLVAAFLGIVGATIILAIGGEQLGLPVLSLLAGLGIGGIAVALAIRPTLENLIGGVILYIDKPVRVGDLCSFGDRIGRVENIGVRSTQLRALDRTQVSIPNAQFVDMQLVNWARCDQMLIEETIGLRYETSPDQLRYVLAKLREMCHAHPRIDNDTVRVRFSGYGDSSLNITFRIFAKTQEWNDFHAIREDIFMRTYDIVTEAGSGFAFPSRTVYMGQDEGLDKKRANAAEKQTEAWRRSGRLPFPRLPGDRLEEIEDTLDYPPHGSPEASGEKEPGPDATQHLSAEPLSSEDGGETDEEPHATGPKKGVALPKRPLNLLR